MARPVKEGMDYFSHDTDAVNDEKIEALRMLYKNDGYAFYFILLERIYRTKDFELDISDAETIQILARKVGVNEEKFNQILQSALKRKCFDVQAYEERGVLTSLGIKKRAVAIVEKRTAMRDKYHKSKSEVSDAETTQETTPEIPLVKESKEKKSKEKQTKKDNVLHKEIIDYLNLKTISKYKHSSAKTKDLINARFNDGYTVSDFKVVIDKKTVEWIHNSKMSKFLRPETLFGSKFESYLQQKEVTENGGNQGDFGTSGTTVTGTEEGYYSQFPGLIKTVSDLQ